MINEAQYSFLCQQLSAPLMAKSEDFFYHPICFMETIKEIISAIRTGTNMLVSDPESMAARLEKKSFTNKGKGLLYKGPDRFPFESLCLWHTPKMLDKNGDTQKACHLMCIQRLNRNVVYINYAESDSTKKIDRIGGEMDFSWGLIPFGFIFALPPDTILKTPLLPLPAVMSNNIRLRKKIIDIKTGQDENSTFVSLLRDGGGESGEIFKYSSNFLLPGIFEVFLGFLEHFNKGDLIQTTMAEEKLVIPCPNEEAEIIPEIIYKSIEFKK